MRRDQNTKDILSLKKEIAYFMRRLYRQRLTTTSGGNISALFHDIVLLTASATDKARISSSEIIEMNMGGEKICHGPKASIESKMHLSIYKARKDVRAIVHAHPPKGSALSASSVTIREDLIAETRAVLGKIAYADYELMGSENLAETVAKATKNSDCIVMRNHGVIALGKDLLQAFDRLEVLEAAAEMTILHEGVLKGSSLCLSKSELRALDVMQGRIK
ncbi:MAG TPA: class II aldolase/adducin family protein [Victivallales bacterium]|nr:class II aldolase/adducin family protein [Victivallales bacterium]